MFALLNVFRKWLELLNSESALLARGVVSRAQSPVTWGSRPSPITIYNYRDLLIKAELLIGPMIIIFGPNIRLRMRTV